MMRLSRGCTSQLYIVMADFYMREGELCMHAFKNSALPSSCLDYAFSVAAKRASHFSVFSCSCDAGSKRSLIV
jgi:hypothetical protein